MKRVLFLLSLCICLLVPYISVHAAAVVEKPDIKIVIEGVQCTLKDVPIIVNGRTLLPLREMLTNLGVTNDDEHIKWDGYSRSITIIKDKTTINLKIDNTTAVVSGTSTTLDVAPIIYKNRTYIPARFVSQSLGKKVAWDGDTQTVHVRDLEGFNRVKEIVEKSDAAMKAIKKAKFVMSMKMKSDDSDMGMDYETAAACEYDLNKKIMHMSAQSPDYIGSSSNTTEIYFFNNARYTKSSSDKMWDKEALLKLEFDGIFSTARSTDILSGSDDATYAALFLQSSPNGSEIVLKGSIYSQELMQSASGSSSSKAFSKVTDPQLELVIDRDTSLIKSIKMNFSFGLFSDEEDDSGMNIDVDCTFKDYNGQFEVTIPQDLQTQIDNERTAGSTDENESEWDDEGNTSSSDYI